jgi:hypothetical protein
MAICLLELAREDEEKKKEAARLMERVPELRQKIAGKSIPMEVCCFIYCLPFSFPSLRPYPVSCLSFFPLANQLNLEIRGAQSPKIRISETTPMSPRP